jgi:hypothetical protein
MKQLKEGVDWNYVIPESEGTTVGIKLLNGKYADTVYQYGKVGFDEQKNGDIFLKFVYNIIETTLDKEKLETDIDFKNHIGDILVNIMEQNMDKGLIDEVGTDYSEESDS